LAELTNSYFHAVHGSPPTLAAGLIKGASPPPHWVVGQAHVPTMYLGIRAILLHQEDSNYREQLGCPPTTQCGTTIPLANGTTFVVNDAFLVSIFC